jgi:hypothetical protein
MWWSMAV